jgi:dTDP-4-amino-4,6-dideoxygalactose transaminase
MAAAELSLPMGPHLSLDDLEYVAAETRRFYL